MTIKQEKEKLNPADFSQFTGTTAYYQYSPLFANFLLTDGTKFLAEKAECYWLMDKIAALQIHPTIKNHPQLRTIQFWKLTVHDDRSATLLCEWDYNEMVYEERIDYTDFPLDSVKVWVQRTRLSEDSKEWVYVAHLPSEY